MRTIELRKIPEKVLREESIRLGIDQDALRKRRIKSHEIIRVYIRKRHELFVGGARQYWRSNHIMVPVLYYPKHWRRPECVERSQAHMVLMYSGCGKADKKS